MESIAALAIVVAPLPVGATGQVSSQFVDLFNGKDLSGWVNVNTAPDTWKVQDGLLICSGHPIGVMRSGSSTRTSSCASSGCTWSQAATRASSRGATRARPREPAAQRRRDPDAGAAVARAAQGKWRHSADRLRPRRAVRRRRRETTPDNRAASAASGSSIAQGQRGEERFCVVAIDGVIKSSVNGHRQRPQP